MNKIIEYPNSKKKPRLCKDETVSDLWEMSKVLKVCDEVWCCVPKDKLWYILHHSPNDFTINWCPNERKPIIPKYNFYNIFEAINFINWLKWESVFYYTGVPEILERQIESFMSMVKLYIPNYRHYENKM